MFTIQYFISSIHLFLRGNCLPWLTTIWLIYIYICVFIDLLLLSFYPSYIGKDLYRHWLLSIPFVYYINDKIFCIVIFYLTRLSIWKLFYLFFKHKWFYYTLFCFYINSHYLFHSIYQWSLVLDIIKWQTRCFIFMSFGHDNANTHNNVTHDQSYYYYQN